MDRRLDSLAPAFKPLAVEFLARLAEARVPVVILNTHRTDAEQAEAVRTGHSWVVHSKHQDGLAMDVAPYSQYAIHGPSKLAWDTTDTVWVVVGAVAERLGLRWGGRWAQRDLGHVELAPSQERSLT